MCDVSDIDAEAFKAFEDGAEAGGEFVGRLVAVFRGDVPPLDEQSQMLAEIDQRGALVVKLEADALDVGFVVAAAAPSCETEETLMLMVQKYSWT